MLINLELFEGKLKKYNERIQECKIEYPDMADEFKEVSSIEDEFYLKNAKNTPTSASQVVG